MAEEFKAGAEVVLKAGVARYVTLTAGRVYRVLDDRPVWVHLRDDNGRIALFEARYFDLVGGDWRMGSEEYEEIMAAQEIIELCTLVEKL